MQNTLEEKLITNKTLYNDNNNLFSTLESKNQEVENLKEALTERDDIIAQLQEEKHNFEIMINNLEGNKKINELNLQKLNNEIDCINNARIEQENIIKELTNDKKNLLAQLSNNNNDIKNLTQKLKSTIDNLNSTIAQLNEANNTILRLDEDLNETENELNMVKNNLNSVNNSLRNERRLKEELQEKTNRLELNMKTKINNIKEMSDEIINLKTNLEKLNKEKIKNNNDISKFKEHIMFLTEINQKLINQLEIINEREQQLKLLISQGEEIPDFLDNTRNEIDKALNNLESGLTIQKFDEQFKKY